jgi:hypothetical protein
VNDDLLAKHRGQLIHSACPSRQQADFRPLDISPWLAMSLMQKAIRRGREEIALRAAATLLRASPDRLWRRCRITAFEDIGVADLIIVAEVTAALAGRTYRARIGGEWPVAASIVSKMARARKCRAADDLLTAAEGHPALESARQHLWQPSPPELMQIAVGTGPLPERAIAFNSWQKRAGAYSCERPARVLRTVLSSMSCLIPNTAIKSISTRPTSAGQTGGNRSFFGPTLATEMEPIIARLRSGHGHGWSHLQRQPR